MRTQAILGLKESLALFNSLPHEQQVEIMSRRGKIAYMHACPTHWPLAHKIGVAHICMGIVESETECETRTGRMTDEEKQEYRLDQQDEVEADVCIAGAPAVASKCGDPECVCEPSAGIALPETIDQRTFALAVAAPELLKAVKLALGNAETSLYLLPASDDYDVSCQKDILSTQIGIYRAAIRKAESVKS